MSIDTFDRELTQRRALVGLECSIGAGAGQGAHPLSAGVCCAHPGAPGTLPMVWRGAGSEEKKLPESCTHKALFTASRERVET
jgi:hypothetical protein